MDHFTYAKTGGEERDELVFEDCEEEKNPRKELRFSVSLHI